MLAEPWHIESISPAVWARLDANNSEWMYAWINVAEGYWRIQTGSHRNPQDFRGDFEDFETLDLCKEHIDNRLRELGVKLGEE